MIRSFLIPLFVIAATGVPLPAQDLPLPVAEIDREEPVDFAKEVLPILKRNCVACHHEKEAEGGVILESHEKIVAGGDSGAGVVPRNVEDSLVFARASGLEEPLMPPEDNAVGAKPLTPEELGLLKKWIEQGASNSAATSQEMIEFQPIPETLRTVYALDVTANGRLAAIGRGNRIMLLDIASGEPIGQLVDPDLPGDDTAALDLVQSIATSPDGQRIATGGFRTVRIWKKTPDKVEALATPLHQAVGHIAQAPEADIVAWVNAIGDIEIWDSSTGQRTHALTGHADRVIDLAITPAGDALLSVGQSGKLIVWNPADGKSIAETTIPALLVDAAFSGDGSRVAVVDSDGNTHLFSLDKKQNSLQPIAQGDDAKISGAVAVAMGGKETTTLAIAGGNIVHLFSLDPLKSMRQIDTGAPVLSVALTPDATQLVTGGGDGKAKQWNVADGKLVQTFTGDPQFNLRLAQADRDAARQRAEVTRLAARSDELKKLLEAENEVVKKATEERDKAKTALDTETQKHQQAQAAVSATEMKISAAANDESMAAKTIEEAGKQLASAQSTAEALEKEISTRNEMLSATRKEIADAQAAIDKLIEARDEAMKKAESIEKGITEKQQALKSAQQSAAEAQQRQQAAKELAEKSKNEAEQARKALEEQKKTVAESEAAKKKSEDELAKRQQALDAATSAQSRAKAAIPAHQSLIAEQTRRQQLLESQHATLQAQQQSPSEAVVCVTIDREAARVATVTRGGDLRVYRATDGLPLFTRSNAVDATPTQVDFVGQDVMALNDRAPALLASGRFRWQLETKIGSVDDAETLSDRVTALDFRRDGLSLAVGSGPPSRSGEVKVFAVPGGELVRDFGEVHSDTVLSVEFSPDGRRVASGAADKTIRLLDVASGEMVRSLEGHTHHVLGVAWQDDGQTLASASADQTIKIWNTETGEQRRTIAGFNKELTAISFVQATSQVVSACADGNVRLHNSSDGKSLRSFGAGGDFLFTVQVTPDGSKLIAAGQSGTVRIWNLADGKLIREIQ